MRQIENEMLHAVRNEKNANLGNTVVRFWNGTTHEGEPSKLISVFLHGNCIAEIKRVNGRTISRRFTLAGWNTPTTRSRLNALGVGVRCKQFEPIFNGQVIDSRTWYEF